MPVAPMTKTSAHRLRQCDKSPSLAVKVMIHERQNVASVLRALLTPSLQLQSVLNSPWIKTNEVIPESDQTLIRGVLQDIETELETIDAELTRFQEYRYFLLLQDRRAGYVKDMKKLRPAIAPHKYLPPEILAEIFLHYAAEIAVQVINGGFQYCCLSQFPWVLGHICSRWRQIALAEPRIWDTIGYHAGEYSNSSMLNEAFRRGGQSRLWLSAHEGKSLTYKHDEFLRDVICSQSKRIIQLSLSVFEETFEKFLSLPSDSFPVLEAIQLVTNGSRSGFGFPCWPDSDASVFQSAARLRRISTRTQLSMTPDSFPMNLCLCWSHLTHINFPSTSIQVSVAHELMNLCTNLHECYICLTANRVTLPAVWIKSRPSSSIHIPHLRKLEVHRADGVYMARVFDEFLRPLVIPNLQQFNFSLDAASGAGLAAIINGLSRPIGLKSELLYIGESDRLAQCTSALPFLTSLKAPRIVLTPFMILMMAQKYHLPNLTSVITGVAYADMDAFINMLEARWVRGIEAQLSANGSTAGIIQLVKIYISNAPDHDSVSRLLTRIYGIRDRLKLEAAMIDLAV